MEQHEIVKHLLRAKNTEEVEFALSRVNVYNYSSVIKTLVSKINTMYMENLVSGGEKSVEQLQNLCDKLDQIIHENDGCNCCNGDEALFYQNGDTNAFIDSKGNIDVMIDGATMRFSVKCCPNCGRKFNKEN